MKFYTYLFLIIIFCGFSQCNSKTGNNSNSKGIQNVDKLKLKRGNKLNAKDWSCYEVGKDKICVPKSWKFQKQERVYYFCYLSNNNDNTYFTIAKYNIKSQNINFNRYLKETYSQLVKDTIEIGEGYTVKKLIFRDKDAFYGEYYTKLNNKSYLTYSMLFKKDDFLFDVALKVEKDSTGLYYETFQDILYNFKIEGTPVFSEKDELEKIQVIDLSLL